MEKETILKKQDLIKFIKSIIDTIDKEEIDDLVIIGIRSRGEFLAKRLVVGIQEQFGTSVEFGTVDINLYRDDFKNKKLWPDIRKSDIPNNIEGKKIILFDDVIYTGRTVRAAINAIMDYGRPSEIKLAVMVDRCGNRELPIHPDYVGIKIETSKDEIVNVYLKEVDKKEEVEIIIKDVV